MARRLLAAAAAVFVATACSTGSAADATDGADKKTVTWWDYFDYSPASADAINGLVVKYNKAHPNIEIKRTSFEFKDFHGKIAEAAAAGALPDIAVVDSPDVPLLASQHAVADLTARFGQWRRGNQFLEPVLNSVDYQGGLFGVPLRSNTTALLYNKDLFAQAGIGKPPTTWEELRETAKATTADGHSGICFAAAPNEQLTFNFLPFVWQAGGDVRSIADKPTVAALSLWDQLVNKDESAPREILQWGHSDVEKQFTAGKCAMMINGPWVVPSVSKAAFPWAAAPLPLGDKGAASPLGGEAWVIGGRSKNVDAAWEVITWLAESTNSAKEFGGGLGAIPNRNDTLGDPVWKWGPGVTVFINEMLTTRPRSVYGPRYPEISEAIWTMTQQVLNGKKKPQEAANEANAKIQPLLPQK
jgi:multiple sugar transport system substrate-binding protein